MHTLLKQNTDIFFPLFLQNILNFIYAVIKIRHRIVRKLQIAFPFSRSQLLNIIITTHGAENLQKYFKVLFDNIIYIYEIYALNTKAMKLIV